MLCGWEGTEGSEAGKKFPIQKKRKNKLAEGAAATAAAIWYGGRHLQWVSGKVYCQSGGSELLKAFIVIC